VALATQYLSLYLQTFCHAAAGRVFLQLAANEHMEYPASEDLFASIGATAKTYGKAKGQ
jgi:hypothetical protein